MTFSSSANSQGELPPEARRLLAGLAEYFNEYTLVEYKSPSDALYAGDFLLLVGYTVLWLAQQRVPLDPTRLSLVVIAPRLTRPYRKELELYGATAEQCSPGIWKLSGGILRHTTWLLETKVLSDRRHPVMAALGPRALKEANVVSQELRQQGDELLASYVVQQLEQFRSQGERFAMLHYGSGEEMQRVLRLWAAAMSPERRREMMQSLTPEERLEGLPPEERVKGLTAEQVLASLPSEQRERLLELSRGETKGRKRGKRD